MKYVSIDLETTGLCPSRCDVLTFGAVIEDTELNLPIEELPAFHVYLKHDMVHGQPYALAMNQCILEVLGKPSLWEELNIRVIEPEDLGLVFWNWIDQYFSEDTKEVYDEKITVAGKNFANFDLPFLQLIPDFFKHVKFHHRVLDPGSMYFNPKIDSKPPGLDACLERAGIDKVVTHDALDDARDVVSAIRWKTNQ